MNTYINGQIGNLERKNVEAIALDAGVPPRTLQEFLAIHRWSDDAVRTRLQQLVEQVHGVDNAIAVIDETSFAKKGNKTTGVQRQYCGSTGKKDNCVVSVHVGYSTPDLQTLLDTDLYLPEQWLSDCELRDEAGIPDTVQFRTKPVIAIDLLRRCIDNGVKFKYLSADELYGRSGEFRREVESMGLTYVVEVPSSTSGWLKRPTVVKPAGVAPQTSRCFTRTRLSPKAARHRRVDKIAPECTLQAYHIKDTDKGPVVWEAKAMRFYPRENGLPGKPCWLIIARNVLDGEMKYFLSNAAKDASIESMLHVAFSRSAIERLFKDSKGLVGLDHFEARKYKAVMRHLILSMVSMLFLAQQTQRLGEKKSRMDNLPGSRSHRSATG